MSNTRIKDMCYANNGDQQINVLSEVQTTRTERNIGTNTIHSKWETNPQSTACKRAHITTPQRCLKRAMSFKTFCSTDQGINKNYNKLTSYIKKCKLS